ncbi:MAG: hypothetical protein ACYDG4_13395 [Desulfuromonadaceae bacterium]
MLQTYLNQYGADLMEALLTAGLIIALFAIVGGVMAVFRDDINEALERWSR